MQDIQLFDFEGQEVIDSRDVAAMIDKRHDHLVRDIDNYISDIEENPDLGAPNNLFIPSTYKTKQNKTVRNYLLTKQGCEFVANKLTGKKARSSFMICLLKTELGQR